MHGTIKEMMEDHQEMNMAPDTTWKIHYEVDHGALYGALVFRMKALGFCQR